jgi:DNA segregation ATPase FtsK/SpoIIIE, S-DNA-T family
MPRKRKQRKKKDEKEVIEQKSWFSELNDETRHSIMAVIVFAVAGILVLAFFGKAGQVGSIIQGWLEFAFGDGFFLVPLLLIVAGITFLFSERTRLVFTTIFGGFFFLASSLVIADIIFGERTGGYVGYFVASPLLRSFDFWGSFVIASAILVGALLIMLNFSLKWRRGLFSGSDEDDVAVVVPDLEGSSLNKSQESQINGDDKNIENVDNNDESVDVKKGFLQELSGVFKKTQDNEIVAKDELSEDLEEVLEKTDLHSVPRLSPTFKYIPPPYSLLEDDRGKPSSGDIKANSNIIKRTLANFGIDVEMAEINVGPSVTQYTLRPAEGVKLARIIALQNDLALALAAHPLRMEAPIPGKSLVGIEVPNKSIAFVGLKNLLSSGEFEATSPLAFMLGRDVTGRAVSADIARMPHLLVAGATGSGKSITMHVIITSLLYKNSPEFLRFIMVDPKRVELSVYNKIPHLLTPVITDAKKTVQVLRWGVREMERRYEKLSEVGARDINSYNEYIKDEGDKEEYGVMPNIVIVIDELADLIASYPREIEGSIVRLAQMSRAVGIHLVVATQRPSVEVITGLIKANITSRIALQVASNIDSRTILDMSGAEKLLGNGDMLFLAGDTAKPRRIQGGFISDKEVKRTVAHVAKEAEQFDGGEIEFANTPVGNGVESTLMDDGGGNEDSDELYEEAKNIIVETQKASASFLQRRLRVGYARAARLLDLLEDGGVVGPGNGAKPRDVYLKADAASEALNSLDNDPMRELPPEPEEKKTDHRVEKDNTGDSSGSVPFTNFS